MSDDLQHNPELYATWIEERDAIAKLPEELQTQANQDFSKRIRDATIAIASAYITFAQTIAFLTGLSWANGDKMRLVIKTLNLVNKLDEQSKSLTQHLFYFYNHAGMDTDEPIDKVLEITKNATSGMIAALNSTPKKFAQIRDKLNLEDIGKFIEVEPVIRELTAGLGKHQEPELDAICRIAHEYYPSMPNQWKKIEQAIWKAIDLRKARGLLTDDDQIALRDWGNRRESLSESLRRAYPRRYRDGTN